MSSIPGLLQVFTTYIGYNSFIFVLLLVTVQIDPKSQNGHTGCWYRWDDIDIWYIQKVVTVNKGLVRRGNEGEDRVFSCITGSGTKGQEEARRCRGDAP